MTIAIAGAMLVRNGRVRLVHRHPKRLVYPDCWNLVGGHIEPGEEPVDALHRECSEEVGVDIEAFVRFDMAVNNPDQAMISLCEPGPVERGVPWDHCCGGTGDVLVDPGHLDGCPACHRRGRSRDAAAPGLAGRCGGGDLDPHGHADVVPAGLGAVGGR